MNNGNGKYIYLSEPNISMAKTMALPMGYDQGPGHGQGHGHGQFK